MSDKERLKKVINLLSNCYNLVFYSNWPWKDNWLREASHFISYQKQVDARLLKNTSGHFRVLGTEKQERDFNRKQTKELLKGLKK